ncbi:DUF948 domain-containing protein [Candidatus Protochlamydia phocaeensis]|uniref:DUF948 domain-containing protein n=1 Tax=Candidatus Protochlamydia phocaeensis TaxID=1414722 RepID=UPI000837CF26|nr:DUF948 domain-containing protein [Candidatus Protochlamydia phocaeensis]
MIIEISVAVIAAAFVVLVIYLIVMTKALRSMFGQVNHLIVDARKQLDDIGFEAKKAVEHTNEISADLKEKMESLDPLFKSVANVGEVLEYKTEELKQKAIHSSSIPEAVAPALIPPQNERKHTDKEDVIVADVLELAGLGIRLWQKLKKRR